MGAMYGDLVNAVCYTAFFPVYVYLLSTDPTPEARSVVMAFAWTMVFSWFSYLQERQFTSVLACLGMNASIAGMNIYGWPHAGQIVVQPQFLWCLLITSGNTKLPMSVKIEMALFALAVALTVCKFSPLVNLTDELPLLLSSTVMHSGFHYFLARDPSSAFSARTSSVLLAGSFAYHISTELIRISTVPGYASEGGYSILRVGLFALIGLNAAGAFKKESDLNEELEEIVRERTYEVLKQAEELFVVDHALQASETSIAITGADQRIVWSNAALTRLTGLKKSQLHHRHLLDALGIGEGERKRIFDCGSMANVGKEVCFMSHGRHINAEISRFPCLNESTNHESQFLVVLKDITAEKSRQKAEETARRESVLAQAMEESMQTLSHELRTPLQGIMGMTSLLLNESKADKDVKDCMTMVMTSARLLLTLINNMLDLRKLDANMLDEMPLTPTDLESSLKAAIDFCLPCASVTNVGLKLTMDGGTSRLLVKSNALRLQQVVINLVANAIKYTATGTGVSVKSEIKSLEQVRGMISNAIQTGPRQNSWDDNRCIRSTQVVVVSVSDAGTGLIGSDLPNVFGRFTQLRERPTHALAGDNSADQTSGTGLGLNLCAKFLLRMEGAVWVTNNTNAGSTFSFCLPLVGRTAPTDDEKRLIQPLPSTIPTKHTAQHVKPASEYRVLVVDDTRLNLKVASRMLKCVGVENVRTAESGREALELMENVVFDLVISDLQMPEMSGTELCKIILDSNVTPKPDIVAFTADTGESGEWCVRACHSDGALWNVPSLTVCSIQ